jgi:hypothetical protein
MQKNNLKSPAIYIHAVVAMLIIQLAHKAVHEIPLAIEHKIIFGYCYIGLQTLLLFTGIVLLPLLKKKWCVFLGSVSAIMLILQPIISRIIYQSSTGNSVRYYPIFPWIQAILILYFSILILRNEKRISEV